MENNVQPDWHQLERLLPTHIREIRTTLLDKYGIVVPCQCDQFISRCMRLKDGKKDKAIKLIRTFYSTVDFKDWEATLAPSLFEDFYKTGVAQMLKPRDSQGRRIFIIRPALWNYQNWNFDEAVAGLWMIAQYANAEFVDVQRNGFVTIWDFSNFSLHHAWSVKQWRLLTLAKWIQNSIVGRIKAFHVIFHPKIVGVLYAGVKPFLKEKLRKRIMFHGDSLECLHKHFDPTVLPVFLGGTLDPDGDEYADRAFLKDLQQQDYYFQEFMKNRIPTN